MTAPGAQNASANVTLTANIDPYTASMQAAAKQTYNVSGAVDTLTAKLHTLAQTAGRKLLHISGGDAAAMTGAAASAALYEKQLGTLRGTAAVVGYQMKDLKGSVESAFTKFPVSRGDVVELTTALGSMGVIGVKNIRELTQTFLRLSAATGEPVTELAAGLTQLSKLFGTTDANQIGNYANALLVVSKDAGVSATGVSAFAQNIAPLARTAGIGQAAVIGIAGAFAKAGADGYVAANTFNSMVADITNLTQSGSPELAKYANLIGVTTDEFKKMDKTTALVQIMNVINAQGPKAITTLNRLGFEGIRSQAAISALVQSGDLQKMIATSVGASGNQDTLKSASQQAMSGVSEELVKTRNNFTQFGTQIGTTFLGPMAKVIAMFNHLFSAINALGKQFSWVMAIAGALTGVLTGAGAAALLTAGLVAKVAGARWLMKSSPVQALKQGFAAGRGLDAEAEAGLHGLGVPAIRNTASIREQAGTLKYFQKPGFYLGTAAGSLIGTPDGGPSRLRAAAIAAAASPLKAARWLAEGQTDFYRQSRQAGFDRKSPMLDALGRAVATPVQAMFGDEKPTIGGAADLAKGKVHELSEATKLAARRAAEANAAAHPDRSAGANALLHPIQTLKGGWGARKEIGEFRDVVKEAKTAAKAGDNLDHFTEKLQAAAKKIADKTAVDSKQLTLSQALARESGALAKAFLKLEASTLRAGASAVLAGGKQVLKAGAKGVMNFLGGPVGIGLMALTGGLELYGAMKERAAAKVAARDITPYLNPLQKLNDVLGVTTTAVANFGTTVDAAAGSTTGSTGFHPATQADVSAAAAPSGPTDPGLSAALKAKDPATTLAYLRALHPTDPKTQGAVENQLVGAVGPGATTALVGAYGAAPNAAPDYATLGTGVNVIGGGDPLSDVQVPGARHPQRRHTGNREPTTDQKAVLGTAATAVRLRETDAADRYNPTYAKQQSLQANTAFVAGMLKDSQGNDLDLGSEQGKMAATNIQEYLSKAYGAGNYRLGTATRGSGVDVAALIGGSSGGKAVQDAVRSGGGTTDAARMDAALATLRNSTLSATGRQLEAAGPGGHYLRTSKAMQAAEDDTASPSKARAAMLGLYEQTTKTAGSFAGTITELSKLKGVIKDTTDPKYIAAAGAEARARQAESYRMPTLSRAQQFAQLGTNLKTSKAAFDANPDDTTAADRLAADEDAYKQGREAQRQYLVGMIQQANAYGVQMERATKDQNDTIRRSNRDFHTQLRQADQDYNTSRARQERDFNLSLKRQAEDAASSIYDPYTRVLATYTNDAGTLLQNLQDQNTRIAEQFKQLAAVKKAGLSQQSIDTLDLANPANAQQLTNLSSSLSPALIAQINAAAAQRAKATAALTQSPINRGVRRTKEDYDRGRADTAFDYTKSTTRAKLAQALALKDMAYEFGKMVKRGEQDLITANTEILGSMESLLAKSHAAVAAQIAKTAPLAAKHIQDSLDGLKGPNLKVTFTWPVPKAPSAPKGSYDEYGHFHGAPAPTQRGAAHATGGISTWHHLAQISEGDKAETIIPLDQRGHAFMGEMYHAIARSVVAQMQTSAHPTIPTGERVVAGTTHQDYSTNYHIESLCVQADDPRKMAAALEAQKRLTKLARPPRAGVSA